MGKVNGSCCCPSLPGDPCRLSPAECSQRIANRNKLLGMIHGAYRSSFAAFFSYDVHGNRVVEPERCAVSGAVLGGGLHVEPKPDESYVFGLDCAVDRDWSLTQRWVRGEVLDKALVRIAELEAMLAAPGDGDRSDPPHAGVPGAVPNLPDPIPSIVEDTKSAPKEHNPFREFPVDRRRIGG